MPSKSAKPMQAKSEQNKAPEEARLACTLRTDVGFEYHIDLAREVVEGILDPEVDDAFIEVPCTLTGGMKRFLHTSYIKEIDVRGL